MSTLNAVKFRLIAALAEDLAQKLENGSVWPGDVLNVANQIALILAEVQK